MSRSRLDTEIEMAAHDLVVALTTLKKYLRRQAPHLQGELERMRGIWEKIEKHLIRKEEK